MCGASHGCVVQCVVHYVVHCVVHRALHGAVHGAARGAVHGAVRDAVHGAVRDAVRGAVHGAVHGAAMACAASIDLQRRVHRRVVGGDGAEGLGGGVEGDGADELVVALGQPRVWRRLVDGEGVEGEGGVRACKGSWACYVHCRGVVDACACRGARPAASTARAVHMPVSCPCSAHSCMPM